MKTTILALLVSVFFASNAYAADATGTVSATVKAPIALSQTTPMAFGDVAPTGSAGTVVIATGGGVSNTNVDIMGGTTSQGVFEVTGDGGATYSVTLPTTATLTGSVSGTMTVDNFNHDAGATPTLGGGGSSTLNIGATLNVGASQAAGSYTGTYTVTVAYN